LSVTSAQRPKGRLLGSDALRALATVWVVVIHAGAWGPGTGYADTVLLARFSVPAFTVLTGLLLGYRYSDQPLGADFARRRLSRTVVPWLAWIPVYLLLDLFPFRTLSQNGGQIAHFVSQGGGHLWYLLLIPQLYLVFTFWPRRHVLIAAAIAMLVQTGLAVWRLYGPLPQGAGETVVLDYAFITFPFWIGYFAVGVALGRLWRPIPAALHRAVVWLGPVAIVASGALLILETFSGATWSTFLGGTGAFLDPVLPLFVCSIAAWVLAAGPALMRHVPALSLATRFVSDHSLGIYIIHPIILYYMGTYYGQHLQGAWPASVGWFLLIMATCVVGSLVASRAIATTVLAPVIGMTRNPLQLRALKPTTQ
jgi:peptidoglycan/LPS O-acetylase OafA/YrhL